MCYVVPGRDYRAALPRPRAAPGSLPALRRHRLESAHLRQRGHLAVSLVLATGRLQDKDPQLDELLQAIEIAEVLLRGRQRVQRCEARGLPPVLDGKRIAQATCNGERSIHDRQHSAEEEQLPGVRRRSSRQPVTR